METLTKTKIVRFAGKGGKIRVFSIDAKGNVREQRKGEIYFRPVSEQIAESVCRKAKVIRPDLDSTVFKAELKQVTKYTTYINGKRVS